MERERYIIFTAHADDLPIILIALKAAGFTYERYKNKNKKLSFRKRNDPKFGDRVTMRMYYPADQRRELINVFKASVAFCRYYITPPSCVLFPEEWRKRPMWRDKPWY